MLKAKIGKWEIELRTDPKELAEKLNINLEVAVKLATLEVASDNQYGENKSEFKNWKNKRIYFTNLVDSKRANGQQRYWDLEENELVDNGLSFFDQKQMKELLELVTVETFYKEEETVEEVKDEETTIKKLREATNMNLKEFSEYLNIPYRTLQNWEMAEDTPNKRKPPAYVIDLIKYKIENERMIKMLKLILKEEGKEELLKEGALPEIVEYLEENYDDLFSWIESDHNSQLPEELDKVELPNFEEVETLRDLEVELKKADMDWWTLEVR